jgi:hypothetical protein
MIGGEEEERLGELLGGLSRAPRHVEYFLFPLGDLGLGSVGSRVDLREGVLVVECHLHRDSTGRDDGNGESPSHGGANSGDAASEGCETALGLGEAGVELVTRKDQPNGCTPDDAAASGSSKCRDDCH